MKNEYLSDAKWDALQKAIANAILTDEDRNDQIMQDHARDKAALLLADLGVCFEEMRADMGDLPEAA
ncbi:hypothetical protein [Paracoccus fontiphilus]|uniref:Uncharacterized protein n=1 Tax=Paracoccus fontiphilus TaxID=1815556 RepID=A0ABV7IKW4_9RHOB|nr:hypothetical protein [Paracoccus fontiphilus]